jgi:putative molybdopterin biosynthesis protein
MIRKASLLHRAEGYLLEGLSAGNSLLNLQQAVDLAVDRWRTAESASHAQRTEKAFRFAGSHDLAVNWLAAHFDEIAPGCSLNITFNGSLAGLVALSQDEADLAGCHLCDPESGEYNLPFVRRILPGRAVKIVTMAHRRLGLITPPGNPLKVSSVADLTKQHLRFINRQPGSGTRSWLDMALQRTGIDPATINGYQNFATTHTEVARSIAEGTADAGIGLESAADAFGLDFIFQTRERYDLVMTADFAETPPAAKVLKWLKKKGRNSPLAGIKGYDLTEMGEIRSLQSPV